jgi:hypothetical protein
VLACAAGAGIVTATSSCSSSSPADQATTAPDAEVGTDSSDGRSSSDAGPSPLDGATGSNATLLSRLAALTSKCKIASKGQFAIHQGTPPTIDICELKGAFFWTSSMNVDCDGRSTPECNAKTDPNYQPKTSFPQSDGGPLVASLVPYVVIPLPSSRFDYVASGIVPGAVVAVVYNGAIAYGVFGDEGPDNLIGEASYAMAKLLGIDPDPATGGIDHGVTYVVLTGANAAVSPIEDPAAAAAKGAGLLAAVVQQN